MSALSFHIRPATVEDVDTLLILVRELATFERDLPFLEATPELLRQNLFASHPIGHVLLVVSDKPGDEGTMIGYMAYYFTFSTWTGKPGLALLDLFIREGYRGQGIGRAVFGELGKIAREMVGLQTTCQNVDEQKMSARIAGRSLGWQSSGTRLRWRSTRRWVPKK